MRASIITKTFWNFLADSSANLTTLFALSAPLVLLSIGIAVNYSHAVTERQRMQVALDSAVLAGVEAASASGQATGLTVASYYFAANIGASSPTATFQFNSDGSLSGASSYALPMLFDTGVGSLTVDVTSTATPGSSGASSGNSVCILLLSKTASPGLLANSGTNVHAANCEIDVASTGNPAATFNAGGTITSENICIAGTAIINNGGSYQPFTTGCSAPANPFFVNGVSQLPAPVIGSCANGSPAGNYNGGTITLAPGNYNGGFNFNNTTSVTLGAGNYCGSYNFSGGAVTMNPGTYNGTINFNNNPNVTFNPGVYVIEGGGWNVNGGSWTGSGVTFYFADSSKIQFNSGMSMTLSAPTTGTYAGILFYELDGLSLSPLVFDDSVSESLSGLIYLPSRNITFNSTSNVSSPTVTVVANTAIFDAVNWSLSPSSTWTITRSTGSSSSSSPPKLTN